MSADAPDGDIEVGEELVAQLVASQHPSFAGRVERVAHGWDNAVFRLGDAWAARMPRRLVGDRLVRNEQRWLGEVAGALPGGVRAPIPVAIGRPGAGYPYAWSITPWFAGVTAASVDAAERRGVAEALADVLVAIGGAAPPDAPANPARGVPLADRAEAVAGRLASRRLERLAGSDVTALASLWEAAVTAPRWTGEPRWIHGDPHPANLLLSAGMEPRLVAILDFGDLTAGDPATDLAAAWLVFESEGRAAFRDRIERLRPTDDATWLRARGWAIVMASGIVDAIGVDGPIGRIGAHALAHVLAD